MSGEVDCSKPLDRAGQAQKLIGVIDALLTQWASLNLHSFDSAFFLRQWPKLHALYEQATVLALGLGFVAPVTVRVHEIPATRTRVPGNGQVAYFVTSPRVEQEVTSVAATWEQEVKGWRVAAEMILAESAQGANATMENAAPAGSTKPGLLRAAWGGGLSMLPALAFESCVHWIPWAWMRDHPNTLPLQIGGSIFLFLGCFGLFVPKCRKWFWRGALFPLALVVLKLLGGRSAPSLP